MAGPLLAAPAIIGKIIISVGKKVAQNKIRNPKVITENIIKKHADTDTVNNFNKLNRYQKDEVIRSANVGFKGSSKSLSSVKNRMRGVEKKFSKAQKFINKYTKR